MHEPAPIVLIVSLSAIRTDVRILRQLDSLLDSGFDIIAIGLDGGNLEIANKPQRSRIRFIDIAKPRWNSILRARAAAAAALAQFLSSSRSATVGASYFPGVGPLERAVCSYLESCTRKASPRTYMIIAHDWTALPGALAARKRHGVPFHYDTHEFSTEEHAYSPAWRVIFSPMIGRIEALGIAQASSVSCPSEGIKAAIEATYRPRCPVLQLRNVPDGSPLEPSPVGRPVEVLYHGLFKPDRGLVELVRGVKDWPDGFILRLRGNAPNVAFGEYLKDQISRSAGRIAIEGMVPINDIMRTAQTSDIGVFLPNLGSLQNRFALPNKFFEYLHAGLMIIAPAATQMGEIIAKSGSGLATYLPPEKLGEVLATLTPAQIAVLKSNAHSVAKRFTWQHEAAEFLALINTVDGKSLGRISSA